MDEEQPTEQGPIDCSQGTFVVGVEVLRREGLELGGCNRQQSRHTLAFLRVILLVAARSHPAQCGTHRLVSLYTAIVTLRLAFGRQTMERLLSQLERDFDQLAPLQKASVIGCLGSLVLTTVAMAKDQPRLAALGLVGYGLCGLVSNIGADASRPTRSRPKALSGPELLRLSSAYDAYTPLLEQCRSEAAIAAKGGVTTVLVTSYSRSQVRDPSDADFVAVISQLATEQVLAVRVGPSSLQLSWVNEEL